MSKNTKPHNSANANAGKLGDEQRVKVLSPSMMVFKRFMRNKLAVTGMIILVTMFVFSFVGGIVSPYDQSQVFRRYEQVNKEYASATQNTELRYVVKEGAQFDRAEYAQFILALNKGNNTFSADGMNYSYEQMGEDTYHIMLMEDVVTFSGKKGLYKYTPSEGFELTQAFQDAHKAAGMANQSSFEVDGVVYQITTKGINGSIGCAGEAAIASKNIFSSFTQENESLVGSYDFQLAASQAIAAGETSFELNGASYQLVAGEDSTTVYSGETAIASISDLIVNALSPDVFLTTDFRDAFSAAVAEGKMEFTMTEEDGSERHYSMTLVNNIYTVWTETLTQLNASYMHPSKDHPLGTDGNGMDMLTRLMYGGRISLMVGFVVVLIELIIGTTFGGISGYFGGWVDTLMMRFVDLFNCIPYWPMMIIAGSVMDSFDVNSYVRIFLLMLIMGLLGWTGIARVVRGQILALREQDFMIATEATGIRVSRRIFRHLVPNVMPLLIVQATMGLGGIIITEATLSYLGLGVKYPFASWGSIINAATDMHVMTNYWFAWIPAGMLIMLTVLGFNFVGDGLRDAFDPKMKR